MIARTSFSNRAFSALWRIAAASFISSAALLASERAQAQQGFDFDQSDQYAECVGLIEENPERALEYAAQWQALGGGGPARHCGAIAMIATGAYANAATELTEIGVDGSGLSESDRSSALALAGDIWLQLGRPELARQTFSTAISLDGRTRRLSIGEARAAAMVEDWSTAVSALDWVLDRNDADVEARTLRAAARRNAGDVEGALQDATRATELAPDIALTWFERGAAEFTLGDAIAARDSWLRASLLDPDGAAGELARRNLERDALGN